MRTPSCIALALVALLLLEGSVSAQRAARREREPGIAMHFEDRDLTEIIDRVARATNQRFVYGDDLRGRVTITVPGRVSAEEAIELLHAALQMRGFAALPLEEGTYRIVPVLDTTSGAPVADVMEASERERPVTTLIELEHTSVDAVVAALGPYVSRNGVALAYAPTNSIVLAGSEVQVARLITIARIIDRAANEQLMVRAIRYRSVQSVANLVDTVFNDTPVAANKVEIWTDDRTAQIVLRGHPARLAEVRELIDDFDQPVVGQGIVGVIRVRNRDAEEVAGLLTDFGNEAQAPAAAARPGQEADPTFSRALSGRDFSITVDVPTQSLLVSADTETFALIARTVAELDRLAPRVSVDVLIFEISRPSSFKLGFDYFLPLTVPETVNDPIVFVRSASSTGGVSDPLSLGSLVGIPSLDLNLRSGPDDDAVAFGRYARTPIFVTLEGPGGTTITVPIPREDVSVQAGEIFAETNILLRPNIIGVSGEEHELFAGNNIPVPVSSGAGITTPDQIQEGTANVPFATTQQNIERVDIGTRLRVKPTVGEEGVVTLELEVDVSELVASAAGSVDQVGPTFADREIQALIRLRPGDFAVLGATGAETVTQGRTGVPYLMDLPGLGWLFSTISETRRATDLVVVVEARVLRTSADSVAESIRQRLAFERAISRTQDLNSLGSNPFAVLIETTRSESKALAIAEAFSEDGFETRVTPWDAWGQPVWDVYLTELASFEEAGGLARRLTEAGWDPEITALSPLNELAGD